MTMHDHETMNEGWINTFVGDYSSLCSIFAGDGVLVCAGAGPPNDVSY
jgi:hypothetical protein